jgi:hypothetical protein
MSIEGHCLRRQHKRGSRRRNETQDRFRETLSTSLRPAVPGDSCQRLTLLVKSLVSERRHNQIRMFTRRSMKTLLFAKAAVEILAGMAFALFPSALFLLLLGVPLDASGSYAFRMFGGAIFAIGIACWLAREDSASATVRGLVTATALYDFVFVILLLAARLVGGLSGIALWPTVALHLGLAIYCLFCLRQSSVAGLK